MTVTVGSIRLPSGEKGTSITNLAQDLADKKSVVRIVNDDSLCAIRAVAVSFCKLISTTKDDFDRATRDLTTDNVDKVLQTGKCSPSIYRAVRQPDSTQDGKFQRRMAERLALDAGLPLDRPLTIADLDPVEDLLNVNVAVLSADSGNRFVRRPNRPDRRTLYLYHHDRHFDAIVSLTGFLGYSYFCEQCCQPYSNKNKHSCSVCCTSCEHQNCPVLDEIECPSCHVICRSQACLERHRLSRPRTRSHPVRNALPMPLCATRKCPRTERPCTPAESTSVPPAPISSSPATCVSSEPCLPFRPILPSTFSTTSRRVSTRCTNARKATAANPRRTVPTARKTSFVAPAGSVETVWPTPSVPPVTTRTPNVARAADLCVPDAPVPVPAVPCSAVTSSTRPGTSSFACFPSATRDSLASPTTPRDSTPYLVLDYLVSQSVRPKTVLFKGTKLMYMEVGRGLNLRFLDSLNFFPMKLAALPKAFGLAECRKGHFPHLANEPRFWNYVGPHLDPSFYGADRMTPSDRDAFLDWHASVRTLEFDFQKELVAYCDSDVDILKKACLEYRRLMLQTTGVDPFTCLTMAAVTNKVFKTKFLTETWTVTHTDGRRDLVTFRDGRWTLPDGWTEDDVASKTFLSSPVAAVPPQGYVTGRQFSKDSILWLEWTALERGLANLRHALTARGEKKFGPYWVDGYDEEEDEAFEYHGCFWHGCPVCYPRDRTTTKNPVTGQSMSELYFLTQKKEAYLRSCGLKLTVMWEHDFLERLRTDEELRDFADTLDLQDRLEPRRAFYGGRTNALRLYRKVDDPMQIRYYDVTSLYPYVLKTQTFPVGHPQIVTRDFEPLDHYFGLAKVKILPPCGLYLPVLPHKVDGRLFFPLCATCAETKKRRFLHLRRRRQGPGGNLVHAGDPQSRRQGVPRPAHLRGSTTFHRPPTLSSETTWTTF